MADNVSPTPLPAPRDEAKSLDAMHIEEQVERELTAEESFVASFSEKKKKKLLVKLDLHIIPFLMALYIMSFIDRANIGNANIVGMSKDLHLSGTQYNTVLSIFFVTYIFFEIPSNYVLGRYFRNRPSWWLGIITFMWGTMMTLHGVVKNYAGITAVRLLMGVFEAGLFPGALTVMNKWYTKYELATRFSLFYVGSALSGAFSGLLAYGIEHLDGKAGLAGWSWIFVVEGLITVLLGLIVPFVLADSVEHAKSWLTEEERKYLNLRMTMQEGGEKIEEAASHFSWKIFRDVLFDWQFYLMVFNYWSNTVPTYGMKFTMPAIMKSMGFTNANAQLLTVPPYIAGAISAYCFGRLSDKFRRRSFFIMIPQFLVVIAYSIITPMAPRIKTNIGVCYFGIVLANIGLYPINPGASSWISNNLAGYAKRTLGLAYIASLTNIGAIGGSFIFIASEAPAYPTGFGVSLAMAAMGIVASVILDIIYARINKKRDEISEEEVREKYTDEDLAALGDRSPLFRYTL